MLLLCFALSQLANPAVVHALAMCAETSQTPVADHSCCPEHDSAQVSSVCIDDHRCCEVGQGRHIPAPARYYGVDSAEVDSVPQTGNMGIGFQGLAWPLFPGPPHLRPVMLQKADLRI
jgi:hypothetical protein